MEQLCDDLLLEIFSKLSIEQQIRIQRVCRRWLHLLRSVCSPRRLRIELTQYPRQPRRRLTESGQLAFEHAPTIRPRDEQQLHQLSRFLCVQGRQLQALCLQLTYFNHLQYFLQQPEWVHALCHCCPRLRQLQLHAYGLAFARPVIDRLQPLLAGLTHLSIDYKEEDISKCREQPWIESVLEIAQKLQVLFIKFKRIAIRFPIHCRLPSTLQVLHLPSCSFNASQFNQLLQNGADRLEQLSLHSIPSECLYLILERMPNLRKVSLGIRVTPQQEHSVQLFSRLHRLEQLHLHLAHLSDEPANDETFEPMEMSSSMNNSLSDAPNSYTICEILCNLPPITSLRLKNIPLIRRRVIHSWFVKKNSSSVNNRAADFDRFEQANADVPPPPPHPNPANIFEQLIGQYIERRLAMDAFDGQDNNNGTLFETGEHRYMMAQLQALLQQTNVDTPDVNSLISIHVRLDEPLLDSYYRHALEIMLRYFGKYRHLRSLQLINVRDRFVSPLTIERLVNTCTNLQRLEIGAGRCISVEVLNLFIDRARKHPNWKYELKMARLSEEESDTISPPVYPSNLSIF